MVTTYSRRRSAADTGANLHLPPHLREVCGILALGLVRLRRRTAEDFDRDPPHVGGDREISLPSPARQSVHAAPLERASTCPDADPYQRPRRLHRSPPPFRRRR